MSPSRFESTDPMTMTRSRRINPGKYNYASSGNGASTHRAFVEFITKAGLSMTHVPYKGGPEAIQGLLKGDVC